MTAAEVIFWLSLAILFYCYAGYGLSLLVFNSIKKLFAKKIKASQDLLPVTIIVPCYNEEAVIEQKIKNTFELDYPSHLLKIIFITDGSTDGSMNLINQYDSITLLHQGERQGKSAALKRAMRFVQTPVVVFTDANSVLNKSALQAIVQHYADEKVGGVAGEKKIFKDRQSIVGQAEGLYWQYESFMKKQDSDFYSVVGAAGELFSLRTQLFHSLDEDVILDDFVLSMQVCLKGYKIKYEPLAFATEAPSASLEDEEKRKTRIAAGAYQSLYYVRQSLNIFKYPLLAFQFFSRRLLRWYASPLLIFLLFICNLWLVVYQQGSLFTILLLMQVVFYLLAVCGRLLISFGVKLGVLNIAFYFLFMNYCLVKGFFNFVQGRQSVLWDKSLREAIE